MIPETSPEARYSHLPHELKQELTKAATRHTITVRSLLSGTRRRNVTAARLEVMRFLRRRGYSYPQIGLVFGLDHSTVHYALKRHPELQPKREPTPFPDYSGEWAI